MGSERGQAMTDELQEFKDAIVARNVVARVLQADQEEPQEEEDRHS